MGLEDIKGGRTLMGLEDIKGGSYINGARR